MRCLIVCVLAATALAFPADDDRKQASAGGCPGGYAEGSEIERGRIVYVCSGGNISPKGCIAEDLSRISIGANFDNQHYRRTCSGSGSDVTFEPVGCLTSGSVHKAGETWDDATQVYTCKQNPTEPLLEAVSVGCSEGGKRVNAKETVAKGDVLYECQPSNNKKFKLAAVGCVKDGKQLKAGEAVEVGKFWFNCSLSGRETVNLRAAGCVLNGKRLNDGDRYNENDVMYECAIDADKSYVRAVACVESGSVERKLGCEWVEGAEPIQYKWTCQQDTAANTATKLQIGCVYRVGAGAYNFEPGCFRAVDKGAFGCVQSGKTLTLQPFADEKAAQGSGLHAC